MSKIPNAKEAILDWFDRNPTAKTRATPLAKALKLGQAITAVTCANLAEPGGPLIRCKVSVKHEDRANGGPKEQWEYCKAMAAAPAPVKPYVPPTPVRRATGAIITSRETARVISATEVQHGPATTTHKSEESETAVAAVLEQTTQAPAAPSPALSEYLAWQHLGEKYACTSPDELQSFIDDLEKKRVDALQAQQDAIAEFDRLDKLVDAALKANESLGEQLAAAQNGPQAGYIVTRIKKPPRRFTKLYNAQRSALSAARTDGLAEVFALRPVGKAVRGAEWKDR